LTGLTGLTGYLSLNVLTFLFTLKNLFSPGLSFPYFSFLYPVYPVNPCLRQAGCLKFFNDSLD